MNLLINVPETKERITKVKFNTYHFQVTQSHQTS